jgi:hypothetical protein
MRCYSSRNFLAPKIGSCKARTRTNVTTPDAYQDFSVQLRPCLNTLTQLTRFRTFYQSSTWITVSPPFSSFYTTTLVFNSTSSTTSCYSHAQPRRYRYALRRSQHPRKFVDAKECIFPVPATISHAQECTHCHPSANLCSREKRGVDFKWGQDKIRGVNIGGWLVLEP